MQEILDITVITLLVIAIVYGFRLNQQIKLIKESKEELATLFKSFDKTIIKAQEGIIELKEASNQASSGLQSQIDKATLLIDDLSFVSEKATDISTKVLQYIEQLKKAPINKSIPKQANQAPARKSSPSGDNMSGPLSPEEVRKIRQQNKINDSVSSNKAPVPALNKNASNKKQEKTKALESLLTQIAQNNNAKNDNTSSSSSKNRKTKEKSISDTLKTLGFGE